MVDENEQIEIDLLLQAIYVKYGYDFRCYARASIKRRLLRRLSLSGLKSISQMQHRLLYDPQFFEQLLLDLSINVTEMYRDPSFYLAFRRDVVPYLKEQPHIKVWHAGCATGEEVYSLAILLWEENLTEKCLIYATDFNEKVLIKAKDGIYPLEKMAAYEHNYRKSGGKGVLSEYYAQKYDFATMKGFLKKNIVFADHNLATDSSFGEMNVILCRNVLIYFNQTLQNRAVGIFSASLADGGFLCLGVKESLRFSDYHHQFQTIDKKVKIYAKSSSTKDVGQ